MDKHGRSTDQLTRENWDTWDPMLISEGLFAAANIFSNLKLVYIFSVNPYLGPLQVNIISRLQCMMNTKRKKLKIKEMTNPMYFNL